MSKLATMAMVVVVFSAVYWLSDIINLLLLSVVLSGVLIFPTEAMVKYKIPRSIASAISIAAFSGIFIYLGTLLSENAAQLTLDAPKLIAQLSTYINTLEQSFSAYGYDVKIYEHLNPASALKTGTTFIGKISGFMTQFFVIVLISYFMLSEAPCWKRKIYGLAENKIKVENITSKIKKYFVVKFLASMGTGLIIGAALAVVGHKYWILWGVLAFSLNFIPSVGSILAAIPPTIIAFASMGQIDGLITLGIYLVSNIVIGSFIEPRALGKQLGLSTLVILLSMLFWKQILGVTGMLLSTPIMTTIIILLGENHGISILLGAKSLNESRK